MAYQELSAIPVFLGRNLNALDVDILGPVLPAVLVPAVLVDHRQLRPAAKN